MENNHWPFMGGDMNKVLEQQCQKNGINLEYLQVSWDKTIKKYIVDEHRHIKRPEDVVLWKLKTNGFQGTTRELHPIMMLLQAGCTNELEKRAQNIVFEDYRNRTFNVQVGLYQLDRKIIINSIKAVNSARLLDKWEYIYSSERVRQWFPGINRKNVAAVLDGLGKERLIQIAEMIFDNPEDNAKGWPDVFAYDGKQLLLIEVKTTDTMRESQIYTWKHLMPKLGLDAKVICVEKV